MLWKSVDNFSGWIFFPCDCFTTNHIVYVTNFRIEELTGFERMFNAVAGIVALRSHHVWLQLELTESHARRLKINFLRSSLYDYFRQRRLVTQKASITLIGGQTIAKSHSSELTLRICTLAGNGSEKGDPAPAGSIFGFASLNSIFLEISKGKITQMPNDEWQCQLNRMLVKIYKLSSIEFLGMLIRLPHRKR